MTIPKMNIKSAADNKAPKVPFISCAPEEKISIDRLIRHLPILETARRAPVGGVQEARSNIPSQVDDHPENEDQKYG